MKRNFIIPVLLLFGIIAMGLSGCNKKENIATVTFKNIHDDPFEIKYHQDTGNELPDMEEYEFSMNLAPHQNESDEVLPGTYYYCFYAADESQSENVICGSFEIDAGFEKIIPLVRPCGK